MVWCLCGFVFVCVCVYLCVMCEMCCVMLYVLFVCVFVLVYVVLARYNMWLCGVCGLRCDVVCVFCVVCV